MNGALPDKRIRELIENEFISGAQEVNVRPASLDLSITGEVFRVRGAFLPGFNETVEDAIKRVGGVALKGEKILLERNCSYALLLNESVDGLPEGVYAYCNPKSSSGRVDMHVRLMVDYSSRYDSIEKGYQGPLWLLVVPKTFPVIVSPGLTLNQMRFFNHDTRLDEFDLEMKFISSGGLLFEPDGKKIGFKDRRHSDRDGSVLLTLGLQFEYPGFKGLSTGEPIDLKLIKHYDPRYFFEPIHVLEWSLVLQEETFYILSTREFVRVPESLTCEMVPMDERSGDLRSHYAGFIDPGWGVGATGNERGRPLTLEVRSFDNRIIIHDGQPIAKIRHELMQMAPTGHYDQMAPTYGMQSGPKLGKQFIDWK